MVLCLLFFGLKMKKKETDNRLLCPSLLGSFYLAGLKAAGTYMKPCGGSVNLTLNPLNICIENSV